MKHPSKNRLYYSAIAVMVLSLLPNHDLRADTINDLIDRVKAFKKAKQWDQVERAAEALLASAETTLGNDPKRLAAVRKLAAVELWMLAGTLRAESRLADAEATGKRALEIIKLAGNPANLVAVLAGSLGDTHREQLRYKDCVRMYQWSLACYERWRGREHDAVAAALSRLGSVYVEQGMFREAEPLYRRALQIARKLHGENHADVAWQNYFLGWLYWKSDDDKNALLHFQRALAIRERVLAKDDPLIASSLKHLAGAQQHLGNHQDAEKLLRRALAIAEKKHTHTQVAEILENLADTLVKLDKTTEAEQCYLRALAIYEKAKGAMSHEVGSVVRSLAGVKQSQAEWEKAVGLYERGLAIAEAINGPQHPLVAQCLLCLSEVYGPQGQSAEADEAIDRALDILKHWSGEATDDIGWVLAFAGAVLGNAARYDEAIDLFRRSITMQERLYGAGDRKTIVTRHELISFLLSSSPKNHGTAEREATRLLDDCRRLFGKESPQTAKALYLLAEHAYYQGRHRDAERFYQQALAIEKKCKSPHLVETMKALSLLYCVEGRLAKAEEIAREALEAREKQRDADKTAIPTYLWVLAYALGQQAKFEEAEELLQRALSLYEKAFRADHSRVASTAESLGFVLLNQGRFAESEALFRRALSIREKWNPANALRAREALGGLSQLALAQGRFAEAEEARRRILAAYETEAGGDHNETGHAGSQLAVVLVEQHRFAEAEPLFDRDLRIKLQLLGDQHIWLAWLQRERANLFLKQARLADAEAAADAALRITDATYGRDSFGSADSLISLAKVRVKQSRFDEAESLYKRALAALKKSLPANHPRLGEAAFLMAEMYLEQGKCAEAEPLADQAIALAERNYTSPGDCALRYDLRAQIAWQEGRRNEAVVDLREAIRHAEQQRAQFAGTESDRAVAFSGLAPIFERMLRWQLELGDAGEALAAIERGRARSLLDEMNMAGADLDIAKPAIEREKERQLEVGIRSQIAALERQIAALPRDAGAKAKELNAALTSARDKLFQHYRSARSSNAVYRNSLAAVAGAPRLGQLQRTLVADGGMLLAYFLGRDVAYVAVITADDASVLPLEVGMEQAAVLGCEPGILTVERSEQILLREDGKGLVQQLATAQSAETIDVKLKALADVLLPGKCRRQITDGAVKRMLIVPDASLALLPFEALVVGGTDDRRYLLDFDAAVCYGPSATVLYNLARHEPRNTPPAVLSVGDPDYPLTPSQPRPDSLAELSPRSRYSRLGGRLAPLPYSGVESYSVQEAFRERSVPVTQLLRGEATESAVRAAVAGKRIVHLACHGLTDQDFGNYFGALALTPSAANNPAPEDDGFLTLSEIYSLDMRGCDLAILSACQTNFGPRQQGEGVWALSRGFLVAGAHRVVATNWLVDDEAAAHLVSHFCTALGNGSGGVKTEYATALRDSKRWVRHQEKWSKPYYWSSFVLIGPD